MKIAVGNDHRGVDIKNIVINFLKSKGIDYKDFGSGKGESADYADYGFPVAQAVSKGGFDRGILICGSGIGMSMVANKVKNIRAALCHTVEESILSRKHNDSNVLVLHGGMDKERTEAIVEAWINAEFESGGRHERRVRKIHDLTGV